jgi:DNA polymerase-3 subunit beta
MIKKLSFRANVRDLRRALHVLNKIVSNNPILPILDNVLIHCVSSEVTAVTGSNLNLWVRMSLTDDPIHLTSTTFILPFSTLFKLVRKLNSEIIDFKVAEDGLGVVSISADEGDFAMNQEFTVGDFPKTPTIKKLGQFAMMGHQLKEGLRLVENSVSTDDLRPAMTKVFAHSHNGAMRLVTTDGATLSLYESNTTYSGPDFYLDKKVSALLRTVRFNKSNYVYGEIGAAHSSISCGDMEIVCRSSDERFPDYQSAIPTEGAVKGALNASVLKYHASLADLFANKATHQASLKFEKGLLTISSKDLDYETSSTQIMAIEFDHEEAFMIGFNLRLLRDILLNCNERAIFSLFAPNRPALFEYSPKYGTKITHLIMPVMLSQYENY